MQCRILKYTVISKHYKSSASLTRSLRCRWTQHVTNLINNPTLLNSSVALFNEISSIVNIVKLGVVQTERNNVSYTRSLHSFHSWHFWRHDKHDNWLDYPKGYGYVKEESLWALSKQSPPWLHLTRRWAEWWSHSPRDSCRSCHTKPMAFPYY